MKEFNKPLIIVIAIKREIQNIELLCPLGFPKINLFLSIVTLLKS